MLTIEKCARKQCNKRKKQTKVLNDRKLQQQQQQQQQKL